MKHKNKYFYTRIKKLEKEIELKKNAVVFCEEVYKIIIDNLKCKNKILQHNNDWIISRMEVIIQNYREE